MTAAAQMVLKNIISKRVVTEKSNVSQIHVLMAENVEICGRKRAANASDHSLDQNVNTVSNMISNIIDINLFNISIYTLMFKQ